MWIGGGMTSSSELLGCRWARISLSYLKSNLLDLASAALDFFFGGMPACCNRWRNTVWYCLNTGKFQKNVTKDNFTKLHKNFTKYRIILHLNTE